MSDPDRPVGDADSARETPAAASPPPVPDAAAAYPAAPAAAPVQPPLAAPAPPYVGGPAPHPAYVGAPAPGTPYGQPQDAAAYGQAPPAGPYGASAGYGPPAGGTPADTRPKAVAFVALGLAILGAVLACIPIVTFFSGIVLLAGFVLALVGLISKKQGGKPISIAALIVSVIGWIISIVVTVVSIGLLGQAAQEAIEEAAPAVTETAAPGGDTAEETGAPVDAQQLGVVEVGYGRTSYDPSTWWYVVILDNPNTDYVYDVAQLDIEAIDAAGTILDSTTEYATLLSGQTAVAGVFTAVGQGEIAQLDILLPDAAEAIPSPADETGGFTVADLAITTDEFSSTVRGTVSGTFAEDQELVVLTGVARDAAGTIIGGERGYVDRLPADGTKVQFEVVFFAPLPADAMVDIYPGL